MRDWPNWALLRLGDCACFERASGDELESRLVLTNENHLFQIRDLVRQRAHLVFDDDHARRAAPCLHRCRAVVVRVVPAASKKQTWGTRWL